MIYACSDHSGPSQEVSKAQATVRRQITHQVEVDFTKGNLGFHIHAMFNPFWGYRRSGIDACPARLW